jgi:hypothetical protein
MTLNASKQCGTQIVPVAYMVAALLTLASRGFSPTTQRGEKYYNLKNCETKN